jgi:hypothetical protein
MFAEKIPFSGNDTPAPTVRTKHPKTRFLCENQTAKHWKNH